jgi:hypothetical protein
VAFVGPHRAAHSVWSKRKPSPLPYDEFRGLVERERATATLAFSSSTQPDGFWLRVYGERMVATTNLFEIRLTFDRVRPGPKPLRPMLNGLEEGRTIRKAALGTLARKFFGGPGAYDGLYELLGRTYRALREESPLPVPAETVLAVNRLVAALKPQGAAA